MLRKTIQLIKHYRNVEIFVAGFLFDVFTTRVDSWIDLSIQFLYIVLLTGIILYQYRQKRGEWTPSARFDRLWQYNVEALHFLYGGLLSVYVVIYFKSGAGSRSYIFLLLVILLFVLNEMPQIRRIGSRLRLSLYAFFVCSYFIYFVPILLGKLGVGVFFVSLGLSVAVVWGLSRVMVHRRPDRRREQLGLFAPAAGVFLLITSMYLLKFIPPVPLSVQWEGVFHSVEVTPAGYVLKTPQPPWYRFWQEESDPFRARPGDELCYFVRLFAPARFDVDVYIRWDRFDPSLEAYTTSDRFLMTVAGGRDQGFRGYARKANYKPGNWRIVTETSDGRTIGIKHFTVVTDGKTKERKWKVIRS